MRLTPKARFVRGGKRAVFYVDRRGEDPATLKVSPCREAAGYAVQFEGGETELLSKGEEHVLRITLPRRARMA